MEGTVVVVRILDIQQEIIETRELQEEREDLNIEIIKILVI